MNYLCLCFENCHLKVIFLITGVQWSFTSIDLNLNFLDLKVICLITGVQWSFTFIDLNVNFLSHDNNVYK